MNRNRCRQDAPPCTRRAVKESIWNTPCWCTILAVVIGLAVTFLFLAVFSVLITKVDAPQALMQAMACIALCAGSFTTGYVAARKRRRKGLLTGLLCGIAMYCVVFVIGLIVLQSAASAGTFLKLIFIILCSCIGGVVGVNAKCRKPHC